MALCAYCDSDTDLYMNGVPVCLECDGQGYTPDKSATADEPRKPQTKTQGVAPDRWPLDIESHVSAVVPNPPAHGGVLAGVRKGF
jgi:hypothetical protein